MMKTLMISCLLLTLLLPVTSLKCEFCLNEGKDCTDRYIEECDESRDQSCMFALGIGTIGIFSRILVLKSCIDTEFCSTNYSSATILSFAYVHNKISCCQTDMCNSEPPEMPEYEKREPNGLKCPASLIVDTDICETEVIVTCRNEEDQCFYYAGRIFHEGENRTASIRGCGTRSVCGRTDGLIEDLLAILRFEFTKLECTKAMEDGDSEMLPISTTQKNSPFKKVGSLEIESGEVSAKDFPPIFPVV